MERQTRNKQKAYPRFQRIVRRLLLYAIVLFCFFSAEENVYAAKTDALSPFVIVGGIKNSEVQVTYNGILIDCGEYSFVVTAQDDWSQYECMGVTNQDSCNLTYLCDGAGISVFYAEIDGGFTEEQIQRGTDLSQGDPVTIVVMDKDFEAHGVEGTVADLYEDYDDRFDIDLYYLSCGADSSCAGAGVLNEEGYLVGVLSANSADGKSSLILASDSLGNYLDTIMDTIEKGAEETGSGTAQEPETTEPTESGTTQEPETTEPTESGTTEEPQSQTTGETGTPNLLNDSYFVPVFLLVIAAVIVGMFMLLKRQSEGKQSILLKEEPGETTPRSVPQNAKAAQEIMLLGVGGYFQGKSFAISQTTVVLGRNPSWCTAVYPQNTKGVSGLHCRVEVKGEKILLTDLGSSYGTYLENGVRLQANAPYELRRGDSFYLAERANTFQIR